MSCGTGWSRYEDLVESSLLTVLRGSQSLGMLESDFEQLGLLAGDSSSSPHGSLQLPVSMAAGFQEHIVKETESEAAGIVLGSLGHNNAASLLPYSLGQVSG